MQQRQKLNELKKLHRDDPEKFKEYMNNHPQLRQRLEDIRQRRENLRDIKTGTGPSDKGYEDSRQESFEENADTKGSYSDGREDIRVKVCLRSANKSFEL